MKPQGYTTLNVILRVPDTAAALAFYREVLGAKEDFRREMEGKLLLAVLELGETRLMVTDASNEPDKIAGGDPRGNGLVLKVYVDAVDDVFRRALVSGAREESSPEDHYFGERSASIIDPFGFTWRLAEFREDVPHDEIERRMRAASQGN